MEYIRLLRPKHYIKNIIILLPLFFSGQFFCEEKIIDGIIGIVTFSILSSSIYIFNDLIDADKDKLHPHKCKRPIASGKVSKASAIALMIMLLVIAFVISIFVLGHKGIIFLICYYVLNILYSIGLKTIPIIDVAILASGFLIRVLFGGSLLDIEVSEWLYLMVLVGALYMGLGKRRNELKSGTETRTVLSKYSLDFLDKNMNVCMGLAMVFYSLWAKESANKNMIWTVPVFILILMRYSFSSEKDRSGDLVEIMLHDYLLIGLLLMYGAMIAFMIYFI